MKSSLVYICFFCDFLIKQPDLWKEEYGNEIVCCAIENQINADKKQS